MSDLLKLSKFVESVDPPLVLVTLVECEGSTYRKPGARLLVHSSGTRGLMSGGCLEDEIARECLPLLSGERRTLSLRIDTRRFLGCDGRLTLWCERISEELLQQAAQLREKRESAYCLTFPGEENKSTIFSELPEEGAFVEAILPSRRLLVFGSAPDVAPLLALGKALEWETEQIVMGSDPARDFPPSAKILAHVKQLQKMRVDGSTACVVMNHHFGRDLELLRVLWESATPFLGLLGSRRRRDQLLEKLAFEGRTNLDGRKLYAPVGIDLGAEGPHEIALEICAQIQKVFSSEDTLEAPTGGVPNALSRHGTD